MLPLLGEMAIEERSAALTFNDVLLLTVPDVAVMVVFPRFVAVASPLVVMVATAGADELQLTVLVMSCTVPSENDPVAVNGWSTPRGTDGLPGTTAMEFNAAVVTTRFALPRTVPDVAVIVELPGARPFAVPSVGMLLLTLATVVAEELQLAVAVMSCVLLSVNVPVALKLVVVFAAMDAIGGATAMETNAAGATVSKVVPVTFPNAADTVVEPCVLVQPSPAADMLAATVFELLHVAEAVKSFVLPSLYLPVALNC